MSVKKTSEKPTKSGDTEAKAIDYGLIEQSLGYLLRRAQIKAFQSFDKHFDALDIKPAQFSALELIDKNSGMRQSRLAEALGIQRTNLVGMLDQLQERDLIKRAPAPDDRRSHALQLTPTGAELLEKLHKQFHIHESELVHEMGEESSETVRQALASLSGHSQ